MLIIRAPAEFEPLNGLRCAEPLLFEGRGAVWDPNDLNLQNVFVVLLKNDKVSNHKASVHEAHCKCRDCIRAFLKSLKTCTASCVLA